MAYSLLTHTAIGSTDGTTAGPTSSIDTTGATLLICSLVGGNLTIGMSDSKGNTWTALTSQDSGSGVTNTILYVKNPTVGTGHTFTFNSGGSVPAIAVAAFSGADTTSPFDIQNGNPSGSGTTIQPGSITPNNNNELIITGLVMRLTETASIDSGFTITDQVALAGGLNYGVALAYKIQTTAIAVNPTWTITLASSSAATIASFKASASGGGGSSPGNTKQFLMLMGLGT